MEAGQEAGVTRRRGVRLTAVLALAAVAAFLVWYLAIRDTGGGGGGKPPAPIPIASEATTQDDLAALSDKLDQPIYWAGDQPGTTTLELEETSDGNIYVRYLTGNAEPGTKKQSFLTIATYPFNDAMHGLEVVAKRPDAKTENLSNGGVAVQEAKAPTSVYVAYPDQPDYQVEVYDPNAKKALELVTSGAIAPVG